MNNNQLKHKAFNGVLWTSIQRFMSIFIQFISGIVLARLLTPDDYGCIGMLSIFMLLAASFIDGGFGSALIQKKQPTQEDYSTIFFWNLGLSLIIYLILYGTAPIIAKFYHLELLCPILRVQGVVLIINALNTIQINQLNKQFKFKKISIVSLTATIISLSITIIIAYNGYGVWSLVAQNLLMAGIPACIYWLTNKWKPSFVFSIKSFKELFNFGAYVLLTHLTNTLGTNIQGLLIGRMYNSTTMGYYSKAHSTEKLASTTISQVIGQVSYPLYSEIQDNKGALINTIKKLTLFVSYLTFPLMFLLMLLAKPLFIFLYSEKWVLSVPYFQILCFVGLAVCLHSISNQSIAAIGKSKIMFKWAFIKQLLGLILIICGMYLYGMEGLLIGMVIKAWLIYFINASLVSKHIGYKFKSQLMDLCPILLLAFTSLCISYMIGNLLEFNLYIDAIIKLIIYITLYLLGSYLFKLNAYIETKQLVYNFILKKKNK